MEMLREDSRTILASRLELFVSRRDRPDDTAQLYVGEFESGEIGEVTFFEVIRPCQHDDGMNLLIEARVKDEEGRVDMLLHTTTEEEDEGCDSYWDYTGTPEMLAEFFELFIRGREYGARDEAVRVWDRSRKPAQIYT